MCLSKLSSLPTASTQQTCKELLTFINRSPSPFHVVHEVRQVLHSHAFEFLSERQPIWNLQPNHRYYTIRNDSAIIAFAVGGKYTPGNGCTIVGAHTDSPCLKVKPQSKIQKEGWLQLGVECYGGGLFHTWFDRDLSLAGRVFTKQKVKETTTGGDEYEYQTRLVQINNPILRVPTLAIHLGREAATEFKFNKEEHLRPILATAVKTALSEKTSESEKSEEKRTERTHPAVMELLAKELECEVQEICDFELCLYDTQPGAMGGIHQEFVFASRLDNLCSSYTALTALTQSLSTLQDDTNVRMIGLFDNEEVGSNSYMGAASNFLESVIRRIAVDKSAACLANSILVSADMAHAIHPNYAQKHETNHQPKLHHGPVIKYNANQRYATTAETALILKEIAFKHNIPVQEFVIKQDMVCGSTIGPIMATRLGVRTIDIGIGQLSMHSIREMCGANDVVYLEQWMKALFHEYASLDTQLTTHSTL